MKNDKQQPEKAEDFYHGIHKYKGDEFPEFIGDKIHVWDDHSNPDAPCYKIQFVGSNEVIDNMDDCDIEFITAPLSNETNINKIDMSDVPASPANEYYSEQGKRMFDRAKVSNETKVVESVREAAKAEMGVEYEPHMSQTDQSFIQGAEFGAHWHASQFKNTDAVKVITDRIAELEKQKIAVSEYAIAVGITSGMISELNYILKLIQP